MLLISALVTFLYTAMLIAFTITFQHMEFELAHCMQVITMHDYTQKTYQLDLNNFTIFIS